MKRTKQRTVDVSLWNYPTRLGTLKIANTLALIGHTLVVSGSVLVAYFHVLTVIIVVQHEAVRAISGVASAFGLGVCSLLAEGCKQIRF